MTVRPFIPCPNTASFELIYAYGSQTIENTGHVFKGSPFSAADLTALRGVLDNWDFSNWKPCRLPQGILQRIRTKALDSLGSPFEDYQLPSPRAGTRGGSTSPLNVTFAVKWATGLTGRSYRGRWYMPAVSMSDITADMGHVTQTYANLVVAAMNQLIVVLNAGGYTLCVTSFMSNGAWRNQGLNSAITGAVAVDLNLDSARRRLPGRGL